MARTLRWIPPQEVADRLGCTSTDIEELVRRGQIAGLTFPSGLRVDWYSVKRWAAAMRGRRIEDLPPADQRVGRWALPSGRTIEIFLSAPVDGVRRLRAFYDDASPLDARDQDDLQTRVLEAAANRIQQLTGRRGIGVFLPVPEGTDLEEGRRVRQEGV